MSWNDGIRISLCRSACEVGARALELALGLDQADDRPAEIGEHAGDAVGADRCARAGAPSRRSTPRVAARPPRGRCARARSGPGRGRASARAPRGSRSGGAARARSARTCVGGAIGLSAADQRLGQRQPGQRPADRRAVARAPRRAARPPVSYSPASSAASPRSWLAIASSSGGASCSASARSASAARACLRQPPEPSQHERSRRQQVDLEALQAVTGDRRHAAVDELERALVLAGGARGAGRVGPAPVREVRAAGACNRLAGGDRRCVGFDERPRRISASARAWPTRRSAGVARGASQR